MLYIISVGKAPYIVKLAFAGSRDGKDFRM